MGSDLTLSFWKIRGAILSLVRVIEVGQGVPIGDEPLLMKSSLEVVVRQRHQECFRRRPSSLPLRRYNLSVHIQDPGVELLGAGRLFRWGVGRWSSVNDPRNVLGGGRRLHPWGGKTSVSTRTRSWHGVVGQTIKEFEGCGCRRWLRPCICSGEGRSSWWPLTGSTPFSGYILESGLTTGQTPLRSWCYHTSGLHEWSWT